MLQRLQPLMTFRSAFQAPLAELFGVAIFVFIGTAANCQVYLSANQAISDTPKGNYLSSSFGWGIGLALGVLISAGISGGHVNPSVTLALAARRGFPWKLVPVYMFAQVLGAVVGAAFSWAQYSHPINIVENGGRSQETASLFATYALPYMTAVSCFFSEFFGTGILVLALFVAMDRNNGSAPPAYLLPVVLGGTLLVLGVALGLQTGFGFNPARDLGTRMFLSMVGYKRGTIWDYRRQYWIWTPIIGSMAGALVFVCFYDLLLKNWNMSTISPTSTEARLIEETSQTDRRSVV